MRDQLLKRLIREPLLHFAALGAAFFAVHAVWKSGESAGPQTSVALTAADADWLKQMWSRQWGRPPTSDELTSLVSDQLREELLAREAKSLGLDVGDTIIRRRLAQKMAFLVDDTTRVAEPTDADLQELYGRRADLVQTPRRVSFRQVFFRKGQEDERIRATLAALSSSATDFSGQGDMLLLGDAFQDQDEQALANLFGEGFARAVLGLPPGAWSSPIGSGYGVHLVKVTAVVPPQPRPFAEVRTLLAEEWRREKQEATQATLLQGLVQKYRVTAEESLRPYLGALSAQVEVRQ